MVLVLGWRVETDRRTPHHPRRRIGRLDVMVDAWGVPNQNPSRRDPGDDLKRALLTREPLNFVRVT